MVVADDATTDSCVDQARRRFPRICVVRHPRRKGTSPTKDLGARHARGEVLVFLDGHCKPACGAIQRLVHDVGRLRGQAIVTPKILSLNAKRWKNDTSQVGHGYSLNLATFACGLVRLDKLRLVKEGQRRFYESPALIGCALAVSRELYEELWGFDPHMRSWGVEDLDFGLKCWLMGHRILHDPEAVIGHRFQSAFENYTVPMEHVVVNQLRMARKNFTQSVWAEWIDRCRQRNSRRLPDHPEGLWARVWQLFEQDRESAEQERSYLFARRSRDEFWYARRFGLGWPQLQTRPEARPTAPVRREVALFASPSPPPCEVTAVTPANARMCLGEEQTFTAEGTGLDDVTWESTGAPPTGKGKNYTTKWSGFNEYGPHIVTAKCGESSAKANVIVTKVDRIVVDGLSPEITGSKAICPGATIVLRAKPLPLAFIFPPGEPVWSILEQPEGSTVPNPPAGSATASITPTHGGTYRIEARCGTSFDTFNVIRIKVSFVTNPVRTGFTIQFQGANVIRKGIPQLVEAKVEPASAVESIDFKPGGPNPGRILIENVVRQADGTVFFYVKGRDDTPANKPNGDTTVDALCDETVIASVQAIVIIPKAIAKPYPQAAGALDPQNLGINRETSPAAYDVPPTKVRLITAWIQWLPIAVNDQFGIRLHNMYSGAKVEERADDGNWYTINQPMSSAGLYLDPVFAFEPRPNSDVLANSQDAQNWPLPPPPDPLPMVARSKIQDIPVRVAGHYIGTIVRQVTATPPNQVTIQWPPPLPPP
jgi:GT2 family glycosyltransferase